MQMHDCQNEDFLIVDCEKDTVWETSQHAASRLLMNDRELKGILFDSFKKNVQILDEPKTQSGALGLIPSGGFVDVGLCLNPQDKSATHSL